MDSPSELRIMCKKQFAWAHLPPHGSGRAVATELIAKSAVLAVVAADNLDPLLEQAVLVQLVAGDSWPLGLD